MNAGQCYGGNVKIPTDLQLLKFIFKKYLKSYLAFDVKKNREAKIHVPIDVDMVAKHFKIEGDLVFGRFYYHLNPKYRHLNSDGNENNFFTLRVGEDIHCVNFPMLSSILADLSSEQNRFKWSIWVAVIAAIISICSLCVSFASMTEKNTEQHTQKTQDKKINQNK